MNRAENAAAATTLAQDEAPCHLPRVALVCDFLEEGWPSMDLFGDMLAGSFQSGHASEIAVAQLRPPVRRRFSSLPLAGSSGFLWNADRFLNRFRDYPRWLAKQAAKFDLFHIVDHSYAQLALDLPPGRTIVTCHDLDTFRCVLEPQAEPRPRWFRVMTQRILDGFLRSAHVITPSVSTRSQLLQHGLFREERVTAIPPGADPIFSAPLDPAAREEAVRLVGGTDRVFLLHVGSTIRRKRIDVMLRVFARVRREFPGIALVRVGGAFSREQAHLANDLGVAASILHASYLSKATLAAIYRKAAILLQTSDAEGFGLPVIEAMTCGCPALASDIAPLREAGGSAAEYCPVADVEAWSETLLKLLREREARPDQWEARRAGARRHASVYTWSENDF